MDREERPDIDQIYMDAVQLMTSRGGWPLNVITMPDQRPIYGGTYFPKEQWRTSLLKVAAFFRNDPDQCAKYARELTEGVNKISKVVLASDNADRSFPDHSELLQRWSKQWDREEGGLLRAPKFPLPDSYRYLMAAAFTLKDADALDYVKMTLSKMAFGGIYDQVGAGFTRYSTDMTWKVPHFEKMLYDNAQMVSLYSDAFKLTGNKLYQDIITETLEFIAREMTSATGGFYSALDADSEGVEGKFYCWTIDEVKEITGDDFKLASEYFNFNEVGYWEHDFYILLRKNSDEEIAVRLSLNLSELSTRVLTIKEKLFQRRSGRIRPGLDNKILCSWNALMISGYLDAYAAMQKEEYLNAAMKAASFIEKVFLKNNAHLLHSAKEVHGEVIATVDGFLEDYAFVIDAFISLYSVTMDASYLELATRLLQTVMDEFHDKDSGLFWFTSSRAEKLIARKHEVQDNVIPSSNAVVSHNLLRLSRINRDMSMETLCRKMLVQMKDEVVRATPWHSRWSRVFLELEMGTEVAICGDDAAMRLRELLRMYLPTSVIAAAVAPSEIALLKHRFVAGKTGIYVCRNQSCQKPVFSSAEAILLLQD
ncbi:MAG: thioredoxin domain-containing protein [Bacteroidetes bacterium]|nr:thioredoxin domain-containing protein [Bacteroidota bacterium]